MILDEWMEGWREKVEGGSRCGLYYIVIAWISMESLAEHRDDWREGVVIAGCFFPDVFFLSFS